MKSTEPTNIFKLGVKETGQSARTLETDFFRNPDVCTIKSRSASLFYDTQACKPDIVFRTARFYR